MANCSWRQPYRERSGVYRRDRYIINDQTRPHPHVDRADCVLGESPTAVAPTTPLTILLSAEPAPDPTTLFIGELHGFPVNEGNTWVAVAEVTILNDQHEPVAGARISGEWDEGGTEISACTTDDTGTCDLESGSIRKRVGQTVFEIPDIEHDQRTYRPELDPVENPEDQPRELKFRNP